MKKTIISSLVAIFASSALQAAALKPIIVADKIDVQPEIRENLSINKPLVFSKEKASFIKVHFKNLVVPQGMVVEVSNPEGTEKYHYGPGLNTPKTYDAKAGDNGVTSFSSMSITGDTAIVRLIGQSRPGAEVMPRIDVDYYMQGKSDQEIDRLIRENGMDDVGPESICGQDNKKAVACYAESEPEAFKRTQPVVRLLFGNGLCTGWRVGGGNHFFTNNHCISTQNSTANTEVMYNYQKDSCDGQQATPVKVSGKELLDTNAGLDYSLFSVNNLEQVEQFGYLGLDPRAPVEGEEIYIAQHPGGRLKELGIENDQSNDGKCKIDAANIRTNDAGYYCDTEGGSSGSPVFAKDTHGVIALHHYGGCHNSGVRMELIWPKVASFFNNQIPDDSFGGTDNQKPVAKFAYQCSELSCSFDASASSDADGTIAAYSWDFGDGSTAEGKMVTHDFAADGDYEVTLTVKDDKDATGTKKKTVHVGRRQDNELENGVPVTGLKGKRREATYYTMYVPEGVDKVKFTMREGTGDADLYVKFDEKPTRSRYNCRSWNSSNTENCVIENPKAGTYHIMVYGWRSYNGMTLMGEYRNPSE